MSDYVKVFDGAAKDAAEATVLGADHDTEFTAIAVAVNSKMDKVVSATAGNLAELDATGNLVDSGIASANLDGLSGVVETRLDTIDSNIAANDTEIANLTPPAEPTNYSRGYWTNMKDGSQATTALNIQANVTEDTWETVGPTGSGATNIWTALDDLPSQARVAIVTIESSMVITAGICSIAAYAAMGGVTPLVNNSTMISYLQHDAASGDEIGMCVQAFIPLDANQVFQIQWQGFTATSYTMEMHLAGYINDKL